MIESDMLNDSFVKMLSNSIRKVIPTETLKQASEFVKERSGPKGVNIQMHYALVVEGVQYGSLENNKTPAKVNKCDEIAKLEEKIYSNGRLLGDPKVADLVNRIKRSQTVYMSVG